MATGEIKLGDKEYEYNYTYKEDDGNEDNDVEYLFDDVKEEKYY